MQNPAEIEKVVALQQIQLMREVLKKMVPPGQDPMQDPLVQIRMKELGIKEQELQRKVTEDQQQLAMEGARIDQQAAAAAARIESQEEIAEERNRVNRERIEVQRQGMLRRTQNAPQGR